MKTLLQRLKEPSTWTAIGVIVGFAGYSMSPEEINALQVLGASVVGVVNIFWKKDSQSQ